MSRQKLVAVYGTLRQGCGNHEWFLHDADYKGTFNSEPTFSMLNLGGFPGLKNGGQTSIVMEVYAVNEEEAANIDALEGYIEGREPHFYDKQDIETPWGTAGVYIYVRDRAGIDLVESGDWKERNVKPIKDGVS